MITRYVILITLVSFSASIQPNNFKENRAKKIIRDEQYRKRQGAKLVGQLFKKIKHEKATRFDANMLADDAIQDHFENQESFI